MSEEMPEPTSPTSSASERRRRLKARIAERDALLVPGAANALSARIAEDLGFEAVFLTGAGVTNTQLGMPDVGLITVTEIAECAARISDVCSLPLVVDIDTGFGNALNTRRSVQLLERSGAAALQIEDQIFPKKCGHFNGKDVVPLDEMLGKLKAALDARQDSNLQIIARTDARAVEGIDRALERAHAFIEVGADITFVEAPVDIAEIRRIGQLPAPQLINFVVGGKTPLLTLDEVRSSGFAISLYANAALQATIKATQDVFARLKSRGTLSGAEDMMATFAERQRLVGKDSFDALDARYKGA
jgi:2-methylisocitrate lyase-like PEP mutase family enzyme